MDVEHIKQELQPGLDPLFKYEIDYVNNLSEPLLIILDYSPRNDDPVISFALSLQNYHEDSFPPKCWITHKELSSINDECPSFHEEYKKISYQDNQFYPFSVNLSGYTPKDVTSIKNVINRLYRHIKF